MAFDKAVELLLGAQPREIMNLALAVLDLLEQLSRNHNWWSNTNLAALAEAQGAELVKSSGRVADHAKALRQGIAALTNAENAVQQGAQRAFPENPSLRSRILDVLRPLLEVSRDARRIGSNVLTESANLARTAPNRLDGIKFEAGERGRQSSIIRQLARQGAQLLPQNATAAARTAVAEAEALPADEREAIVKTTGVIAAMRQAIVANLRLVTAATRAALARWLTPLGTMLEFLATALGSLSSFIVVPRFILDDMLKSSGLRSDIEA